MWCLLASSLSIPEQDLHKRSLGKICWQPPSWQNFCMRCFVLCQPAQWKCTWTCHQSQFLRKFTRENAADTSGNTVLCETAQATCTWTCHKIHFAWKCVGERAGDTSATPVLRELAQSKCTWTYYKSHFAWKFTRKMPDASPEASVLCELAQSKCTGTFKIAILWKFARKMPDSSYTTSVEHRASTPTVRTPQYSHTAWEWLAYAVCFRELGLGPSFYMTVDSKTGLEDGRAPWPALVVIARLRQPGKANCETSCSNSSCYWLLALMLHMGPAWATPSCALSALPRKFCTIAKQSEEVCWVSGLSSKDSGTPHVANWHRKRSW